MIEHNNQIRKITKSADYDSISHDRILSILQKTPEIKVLGMQRGYYDHGVWPAFLKLNEDKTANLESLSGHTWNEFSTQQDYTYYNREGYTIGIRKRTPILQIIKRVFRPRDYIRGYEDTISFLAEKIGANPFTLIPEICEKDETPILQYLRKIDDNNVTPEFGPQYQEPLKQRRAEGHVGDVVYLTTIYLDSKFVKNTNKPKTEAMCFWRK